MIETIVVIVIITINSQTCDEVERWTKGERLSVPKGGDSARG